MTKDQIDKMKAFRKDTNLPEIYAHDLLVESHWNYDVALKMATKSEFAATLCTNKPNVYIAAIGKEISKSGTPVTQDQLENPAIQAALKSQIISAKPYIPVQKSLQTTLDEIKVPANIETNVAILPVSVENPGKVTTSQPVVKQITCPHCDCSFELVE